MSVNANESTMIMERIAFPSEAIETIAGCTKRLEGNTEFNALIDEFLAQPSELNTILEQLKALGKKVGENEYTLNMAFLIGACPTLREWYAQKNIDEEIFWKSIEDFKWKLIECKNCEEVWGTFVPGWYRGFFEMTRFGLGRFQFEEVGFDADSYEKLGHKLQRGDRVINFHIPSAGPLTDEKRIESYKLAYKFFGGKDGEAMPFVCGSWLLYKGHKEFLPENSNILRFMHDFDIIRSEDKENFSDGWRVFAKYSDGPIDDLPEDTSIRRAFKRRLQQGKPTGSGYGVFFFDGEKIL